MHGYRAVWVGVGLSLVGCDDGGDATADTSPGPAVESDAAGDVVAPLVEDAGAQRDESDVGEDGSRLATDTGAPDAGPSEGALPGEGRWYLVVSLEEVGGIDVPFSLDIGASVAAEAGGGTLSQLELRATGADLTVSDPVASIDEVTVEPNGVFLLPFQDFIVPARYSPSGSDVVVSLTLIAQARSEDAFCGTVTGSVVTLSIGIAASTFAAVPWGMQTLPPAASCDPPPEPEEIPRIEVCPALQLGDNVEFPSANLDRRFRLFVPQGHSSDARWPLVVLWHGLGSSVDNVIEMTALDTLVDSLGFILAVPASQPAGIEWLSTAYGDNADLVFFDDLVRCLTETYNVDPDRVHIAGMSAGGLWAGMLTLVRSEVLASSALMSGGLMVTYVPPSRAVPALVAWGGEEDLYEGQDFGRFAQGIIRDLGEGGHFMVTCDHGQGHDWWPEFSPWMVRFLLDHPRTVETSPYAADGLPDLFPDFCQVGPPQ